MQPINELDSGMMPPPSTMPLSVRRPSAAGVMCNDQQQISPTMLKSEIMDENSQGSQPDMMNQDSMDRISNENSMDGSSPIKDLQYGQQQRIHRKHSIELMDGNSMMVNSNSSDSMHMNMHDSNSMTDFDNRSMSSMLQMSQSPEMKVVDLCIKQEQQIAAQLQQLKNDAQLMQVVQQSEQSANKFLSNDVVQNLRQQQVVDSVAVAIFTQATNNAVAAANQNTNSRDLLYNQEIANINNQINAATNAGIEQTFSPSLLSENGTVITGSTPQMGHMLSYPTTPPNNSLMNTNSNSPLSQDIILNSQPSVTLSPLTIMTGNAGGPSANVSSDIILNPSVSPTMMCQNSTDTTNIMPTQVTSVLSCHSLQTQQQQQQTTQDTLMNALISPEQQQTIHHLPRSPVAVKNMILNAAADILSSQPSTISPETTISALISLNSASLLDSSAGGRTNQSSVPQIMMTQAPTNSVMLQPQATSMDVCCNQRTIEQHMPALYNDTTVMAGNQILSTNADVMPVQTTVEQQSMLNVMGVTVPQQMISSDHLTRAQQDFLNDFQKMHQIGGGKLQP